MHPFVLHAEGLSFHLPGRTDPLFSDLTLTLPQAAHALVGRNGVGKSVLARILAGLLHPSGGTLAGPDKVGYLAQHNRTDDTQTIAGYLGVADKLTALDRLQQGRADPEDIVTVGDDWTLAEDLAAAMEAAGLAFPPNRPVTSLSGGEQTRLALFRLMRQAPDYLILDEPSNHLDSHNRRRLLDQIMQWDKGCLIISHDPLLLDRVEAIHELSQLGLKSYGEGYRAYRDRKQQEQNAAEQAVADARKQAKQTARKQQEAQERQQQRQAQGKRLRHSGSQSKMLMDARKNRSEVTLNRLAGQRDRQRDAAREKLTNAERRLERIKTQGFSIPEPTQKSGIALGLSNLILPHGRRAPISLTLSVGDRLAVTGSNGSGKSTLLRVILGELIPTRGHVATTRSIGYLDQQGRQFDRALPALDSLKAAHPDLGDSVLRTKLANIGLRRDKALQPFRTLSGGERMKVALLRLFAGEDAPSLILLDEPDNHLDLDARQLLIDSLNAYQGAIVLVTHSPDLIEALAIENRLRL